MVVVFSTFLLILWCFLLILHLHFQTVWGSNIVQKYHLISHIFVIALSVTFTILPSAMGKISFGFGAVCLVSPGYDNTLFWYPLAIFAIPGFLIHFCTFLFVGKVKEYYYIINFNYIYILTIYNFHFVVSIYEFPRLS
jgi:hypothetical protein